MSLPREFLMHASTAEHGTRNGAVTFQEEHWPTLDDKALHGLAGEIVNSIAPHTEADSAALLANLLSAFGNAVGRSAYFRVGASTHYLNLFAALVGETAKGRKGMSWSHVHELMHAADGAWADDRIANGLSSGEGLIYAVRDRMEGENSDGDTVVKDSGVQDKRLLVVEGEFATILKVMTREGNTLSPIIRQAWDDNKLNTLTRNHPLKATGAHISIVGHITKAELLRQLSDTDTLGGFTNRFLWIMVRRSKQLPFGGEWHTVDTAPLIERLRKALEFARKAGEITWGHSARERWRQVYESISEGRPGLFGAATSRAEAQTVRLAAIFAVMDLSHTVERGHLEAALAFWRYAEASAHYIFGDTTSDPVADRIMEALEEERTGLTRTDLHHLFGRNKKRERIDQALKMLEQLGRVRREKAQTGGRPAERWLLAEDGYETNEVDG